MAADQLQVVKFSYLELSVPVPYHNLTASDQYGMGTSQSFLDSCITTILKVRLKWERWLLAKILHLKTFSKNLYIPQKYLFAGVSKEVQGLGEEWGGEEGGRGGCGGVSCECGWRSPPLGLERNYWHPCRLAQDCLWEDLVPEVSPIPIPQCLVSKPYLTSSLTVLHFHLAFTRSSTLPRH